MHPRGSQGQAAALAPLQFARSGLSWAIHHSPAFVQTQHLPCLQLLPTGKRTNQDPSGFPGSPGKLSLFIYFPRRFFQDRPQEKPICIFISNLEQLRAAAPPISPLLWEFMENVYPGGIGCIIRKGEWLKKLGEMSRTVLLSPFRVFSTPNTLWDDVMGRDSGLFIPRNPPWSSQMLRWMLSRGC